MRQASDRLGGKNDLTDKYTKSHFCNHKSFFFFLSPMDFPPHWYAACLKWLLETQPVKWAEEERKPSPAEYIKIHTTSCRLSI